MDMVKEIRLPVVLVVINLVLCLVQGALFSIATTPLRQTQLPIVKFPVQNDEIFTEKPGWVHTCNLTDPEVEACMRDSVQLLLSAIISGEAEKTQVLDPLKIAHAYLTHTYGHGAHLNMNFSSIVCSGAKSLQVQNARYEVEDGSLHVALHLPEISLEGKYQLYGHVVMMHVVGNGSLSASFGGVNLEMTLQLSPQDNGAFTGHFTKLNVNTKTLNLNVTGLYHGADPRIGELLGAAIHTNALELFSESREDVENGLARVLQHSFNSVLHRLPIKMWLELPTIMPTLLPPFIQGDRDR